MFKQSLLAAVVVASLGMAAGPTTAAVNVSVDVAPPPPRHEVMPAPRRGYDWTPGYWAWDAGRHRHVWVAGTWVRSRPGYVYTQPTWVEHDGRWQHRRGAWARGDRDGIPNSHDRDRDGDGVPNRRDSAPDNPRRN